MKFEFTPVGLIHSPFKEKFGTPRQPGLIKQASFSIEILPPFDCEEAFEGLQDFSHLWLVFVFHKNSAGEWHPKVRPPRLGGNQRLGVFATRSPYRPNPVGLSAVELDGIRREQGKLWLDIKGADLIDGTPVLDIKPYIPYSDSIHESKAGYASAAPQAKLRVLFSDTALQQIRQAQTAYPDLQRLISQILELDPRPAYVEHSKQTSRHAMKLLDYDIHWQVEGDMATVLSLHAISD